MELREARQLAFKVGRFGMTGLVATSVNYFLYLFLVHRVLPPVPATMIAYFTGGVINFFLQRYFVFDLRRSARSAFALSMLVSLGGLLIDASIIWGLHRIPALTGLEWLMKLISTGSVFVYNFIGKRWVFEGRPGQN